MDSTLEKDLVLSHSGSIRPHSCTKPVLSLGLLSWRSTEMWKEDYFFPPPQGSHITFATLYPSDHELLIAKFRLKLKKVGKTTRPFRYDLNQIPYDYTVEVTNRFKVLDLMECLKNYGWRFVTLYRRQWSRPSPRKRNAKRLSEEVLQAAEKRREVKGKGEKERYTHLYAEFQRIAQRDKKAFLSDQCKEIEGKKNSTGKTRDLFKKSSDTKGTFHAKTGK